MQISHAFISFYYRQKLIIWHKNVSEARVCHEHSSCSNAEHIFIKFTSSNYTPYSLAFHCGPAFSLVLGNISKTEIEQKQNNRYAPCRSSASVMVFVIINNMKKNEKRNTITELASIIFTSKQKQGTCFLFLSFRKE